jgi:methylmalonyl-CoA carboxyltransferase large subunit
VTEIDVEETNTKMSDSVPQLELDQLRTTLEEIRAQLASISERVTGFEKQAAPAVKAETKTVETKTAEAKTSSTHSSIAVGAGITEKEVLAISAALAAWLGVQPHIRQIRLIRTSGWAQQGRVTIQTSHGLYH